MRDSTKVRWLAHIGVMVATTASAWAEPSEPVHLTYAVPSAAQCPDQAAYHSRLRGRTKAVRFVATRLAARRFIVRVSRTKQTFTGTLEIHERNGAVTVRHVDGSTCAEVVDALALITALALDPQHRKPPPIKPPPPRHTPKPRPSPHWQPRAAFGLIAGGTYDATPNLAPIGGVFGHVSTAWAAIRLSVATARSTQSVAAARAELSLWVGRLEMCRRVHASSIEVSGCARLGVGSLFGRGTNVENPMSSRRLWMTVGAGLAMRLQLTRRIFTLLQGSVDAPLIRDRFLFEPDTTVHRPGVLVPEVMIGLGVWFL